MKQVQKTDRIKSLIAKAVGDPDANTDNLAVYEAVIANGRPLRKQGLYAGGIIQQDAMSGMADAINSDDHVPLQLMHRGGIPVGKVFHAEMKPTPDGGTSVHALFYLPKANSEYVSKIDAGVINDVSVGFFPRQLQCSACGFDYTGPNVTFENIYDCVCDQGHRIGVDGVHARIHGVSQFHELSLVDKGAVPGATILPRAKQSMALAPNIARFSELGIDERPFYLAASMAEFTPSPANPPAKDKPAMDELITLKADLIVANRDVAAKDALIASLKADLTAAQTATAQANDSLAAALKLDGAKAIADLKLAMELIREFGAATLSALGQTAALPETTSELIATVRKARADLSASLVAGGRAQPAAGPTGEPADKPNFAAFKRS